MNVLFINEFRIQPQFGGVQRVTLNILEFLSKNDVRTFSAYIKENYYQHDHYNYRSCVKSYKFIYQELNRDANVLFLSRIIKMNSINIVINQCGFNQEIIKLCTKANPKVPIISVLHSRPDFELVDFNQQLLEHFGRDRYILRIFKTKFKLLYWTYYRRKVSKKLKSIYDKSSAIVLLSSNYIQSFVETANINDTQKIIAIPNPIDPRFRRCNHTSISIKKKELLYVGRLNKGKRIDVLLKIWDQLERNYPDWTLSIVGDGPELDNLLKYSEYLKQKNVIFSGHQNNPEQFYQKASIFVMTSAYEGFPLVIAEAQYFGVVPVVYNSFASLNEMITNEVNGFIIPDLNAKLYIQSLKKLMDNHEFLLQISEKCIQKSNDYDINLIGSKWIELLKWVENKSIDNL